MKLSHRPFSHGQPAWLMLSTAPLLSKETCHNLVFLHNPQEFRKNNQKYDPLKIRLELHWKNSEAATVSKLTTVL
jgi:hypothetical protein